MRAERWLYMLPLRLRSLFRPSRVERELDDELRFHVDRLTQEHVARGMRPADARVAALRAMGGVEQRKEECRDARRVRVIEDVVKDVGYAIRMLRRTPAFTAAAILSLALGIGANTAIFSVVNAVVLRPLAYRQPESLVVVGQGGGDTVGASTFLEWRAGARSFERMGAAEWWTVNLTGPERTEQLLALHISTDILPMLGVEPLVGRAFRADEEHPGRDHVVVLGFNTWKNRFAADRGVVGRTISLDGEPYLIVGVMPESFHFAPFWATRAELWAPLTLDARKMDTGASLRVFARLHPGVMEAEARADVTALTAAIQKRTAGDVPHVSVTPLHEKVVGDVKPALFVLLAATLFVLLIACANVAHLQLVRAATRERELAVRAALGASRARVVRQLLTESAILCAAGAAAAVLLAYEGVRLLVALAPPTLPRANTIELDRTALAFMLLTTVFASVASGLAPALRASSVNLTDALAQGGRASADGAARNRIRSLLIVSEFAMAMVLLAGAGLILRSFVGLLHVDSGFDPANVASMEVSAAGTKEADPARRPAFFQELVERVRGLPGVESAGAINHAPLAGDIWRFLFAIQGRPLPREEDIPGAAFRVVLPGYFQMMRIPFVRGRDFTEHDRLDAPRVVIINDFMARHHWLGRDPIGERIAAGNLKQPEWCAIVGVVRNVKQANWEESDSEEMYFPYLQSRLYLESPRFFATYLTLVVRTSSDPAASVARVQDVARGIDRGIVVTRGATMQTTIEQGFVTPRFYMWLLGAFAVVASLLAAVGIFGVISHSVARRTHEIGVRMALGADSRNIVSLVIGQGVRLAALGGGIGLVAALGLTRYLRTLLFGIEPIDPVTFAAVGAALAVVALAACYVPARRASSVDPMTAVRGD